MSVKKTTPEEKLGTFVRMLTGERDGEVVAAARAIERVLKSAGKDIHALAEHTEQMNGDGLTEAEMQKLYDAGYRDGMQAAEDRQYGSIDIHNSEGTPESGSSVSATTADLAEMRSSSSTIWPSERFGASH